MVDEQSPAADIGAYCRQVEDYLTRANAGHLVRIVGPGFEIVRAWALEGIPLSVVYRGIDFKVERHNAGGTRRPLRIEFCEPDVRAVYDNWRRAVGVPAANAGEDAGATPDAGDESRKRPSLSKHFERVIDRLSRAAGRLDLPDAVRDAAGGLLTELTTLAESARGARGPARDEFVSRLGALDATLRGAARDAAPAPLVAELEHEATRDLAAFRGRLTGDRWRQALDATVDRLLRDRWGLPTLDL